MSCGRERIGLLGGTPDGRSHLSIPGERELGYRKAMRDAGLELDEDIMVNGNFSIGGGLDATMELLSSGRPPDALFALSDEMAAGAIQAARNRGGCRSPTTWLSLGSTTTSSPRRWVSPRSVRPVAELAELAAQALLEAVEGKPWSQDRVLPHELVMRATSC